MPDPAVPSLPAAAAAVRELGGGGGGRGSSLLQVGKPCTNKLYRYQSKKSSRKDCLYAAVGQTMD